MRITEKMMTTSYNRNLQNNLANLNNSSMKLQSRRQYSHVSEDPARATKAFAIRTQIARNEEHSAAVKTATGELNMASSNVMTISSILETVYERAARAGGNIDQTAVNTIAEELSGLKGEILSLMNVEFGDKYLFGGTNVDEPPFTLDDTGALLYNGVAVDAYDPADPDTHFPANDDVYLDVGYGSTGLNGGKKGVKISTSGIDVLGYGKDANGLENNIYSIIDKIETQLRAGDRDGALETLDNLKAKQSNVAIATAEIGTRQNILERTASRLDTELLNLQEMQQNLEGVDMESEAVQNQSLKAAWLATLQLGTNLILPSIFDFMY